MILKVHQTYSYFTPITYLLWLIKKNFMTFFDYEGENLSTTRQKKPILSLLSSNFKSQKIKFYDNLQHFVTRRWNLVHFKIRPSQERSKDEEFFNISADCSCKLTRCFWRCLFRHSNWFNSSSNWLLKVHYLRVWVANSNAVPTQRDFQLWDTNLHTRWC